MSEQLILLFSTDGVEIRPSLEDAMDWAWIYYEHSEYTQFVRIEVIEAGKDPVVLDEKSPEIEAAFKAKSDSAEKSYQERKAKDPVFAGNVKVDGAVLRSFYGLDGREQAMKEIERLRPFLGVRLSWAPAPKPWR